MKEKGLKVVLFGGTFDPIHSGHLQVAQFASKQLHADELIFIPAGRSPHKQDKPVSGTHRYAMIECAIQDHENFSVSDCELQRPEPSYTLDTVLEFRRRFGNHAILCWLIGADQLEDFEKWYRVTDLLEQCKVCVMYRAGYPKPDFRRFKGIFPHSQIEALEKNVIPTPLIDLNSTEIRQKLTAGIVPVNALPEKVISYIKENRLYT